MRRRAEESKEMTKNRTAKLDRFDRRPYKESVSNTCPLLFSPSRTNGDTSYKAGRSADRYGSPPGRFDERGDDDDWNEEERKMVDRLHDKEQGGGGGGRTTIVAVVPTNVIQRQKFSCFRTSNWAVRPQVEQKMKKCRRAPLGRLRRSTATKLAPCQALFHRH
jgi:hypothetical protein